MKHLKTLAPIGLGYLSLIYSLAPVALAQDTESFEYDALGRLVKTENIAAGTEIDYAYDAVGNRTQVAVNGGAANSFSIDDVTVTEGGTATFTVTRAGATAQIHNVGFATSNNTATAGNDYSAISGTLAFGVSETAKTLSVTTTNDGTYELGESFSVNLSAPTNGASISDSQGIGAINDNDPASAFSVNNVSVSEGGALLFTVTKSGLTSQSHSVAYSTANGSAGASDYTGANGTLVFTSAQTAKTVSLSTTGDSIHETNETLYLNLSNPTSGATIADSQGVGTLNNDDAAPSFSVNNVSVSEGGALLFTVTKSGLTSQSHSITYSTANGSAGASDYTGANGTLVFTSAQTAKTVSLSTIADSLYEANETLYVNLSNATSGATIADSQGVGTLNNDDAAPSFSVNNVTGLESQASFVFTVTKSGATSQTHAVSYATASSTAHHTSDYSGRSGSLSFTTGQTTQTVSVPINADPFQEPTEVFLLNLSSPTNSATISDSQGIGTIFDDDNGCEMFCD